MTTSRLADLIAGKCRVRVGGVEGVLDGFTSDVMWLLVEGERVEVPAGEVSELEPLDAVKVAAHWAAIAESDQVKASARAKAHAMALLAELTEPDRAEVLGDAALRWPPGSPMVATKVQ